MTRALVTSSKYSPGNMMPPALEALFVGRKKLLKDVLNRLVASTITKEKHFIVLVGPRGVGKTHFVALLHHRLTHDPAYASARKRLKIAYLNEEEWGVASFLDLLVRILRALAAGDNDEVLLGRIEQIYSIYDRDPSAALQTAQSALRQYLGSHTLLVICENLLDIFQGIGLEGQKRWRAWIQEEPFWTILATTPAMFGGLQLQTSPFFGFFTIRNLEKLDLETAILLLQQKAILDGNPDLAETLRTPTGRARVHAIHHLAGGNHRVYVTMSDFLTRESLDDLVTPFMRMVDDITPYYQDRMRQLAPQQRKIVEFLCHTQHPIVVKAVAHRCLMSQQTAAKQLGELAKSGFVDRTKQGRETYYELAEPLMRICVEVKDNRTEHIKLFVEFLREWFTGRELKMRFQGLQRVAAGDRQLDRIHLEAAISDCEQHKTEPFLQALRVEIGRCLGQQDHLGLSEAAERLVNEGGAPLDHWLCMHAFQQDGKADAVLKHAEIGIAKYPDDVHIRYTFAEALAATGQWERALVQLDRAIEIRPKEISYRCFRGNVLSMLERYEEVLQNEKTLLKLDPTHVHSLELQAVALNQLERYEEAEAISKNLIEKDARSAIGWGELGRALHFERKNDDALTAVNHAIALDPQYIRALCLRGSILNSLNKYEETLQNQDNLLRIDGRHSYAALVKIDTLLALRRFDEAERIARKLIEEEPNITHGWERLAHTLMLQQRHSEAIEALDKAIAIDPGMTASRTLFTTVRMLLDDANRPVDALALTDRALELSPGDSEAWLLRAKVLIELSRYDEAQQAAEEAHRLAPEDPQYRLIVCLTSTGLAGLVRGTEWLTEILRDRVSVEATLIVSQDELIARMLMVEARERGAVAMARQIGALRKVLAAHAREGLLAGSLTTLLRVMLRKGSLGTDEWVKAAGILQTTLADLRECLIPLEMLSVAARYAISKDTSVLLELPLEQRTLLTQVAVPAVPDRSDRNDPDAPVVAARGPVSSKRRARH